MDKLKFRCAYKNQVDYILEIKYDQMGIGVYTQQFDWLHDSVDEFKIELYTTVDDINGVEIYDGDKVKWKEDVCLADYLDSVIEPGIGVIKYCGTGFCVMPENEDGGYDLWHWDKMEVIGNIHENKVT